MTLAATNGSAAGNAGGATSVTTSAKTTAASGSGFIACFIYDLGKTLTVSDSKGNSYTLANAEVSDASGGFITRFYYCLNGTGGSGHTLTGTLNTTGTISAHFCEITTTNGAGITLDQANQNSDVASPFTSPSVTTLTATEIAMSYIGGNSGSNPATNNASANSYTIVSGSEVTNGASDWVGGIASKSLSATGAQQASWTQSGSSRTGVHIVTFSEAAGGGGSAATLSSGTPSGTIGTTTSATIGATTDQSTGTFYAVVDSAANLSGVTATQIKAGQKAAGTSALASGSAAVSTTAPAVGVTGLSAATLYSYAAVQNNANGDSNVVTGTFTTASTTPSAEISKFGPQGAMKTIVTL